MGTFTGKVPAQLNPPDGLAVMAGPIYATRKCNIPPQPDNLGTYDNPGGHRSSHDDSGSSHGDDGSGHDDGSDN